METLPKEVIIGAIGSVIGALIVYLGQSGLQLTKKARERSRDLRNKEKQAWLSKIFGIRQGITNEYLFSILRYLFLGNLLWLIPDFIRSPMEILGITFNRENSSQLAAGSRCWFWSIMYECPVSTLRKGIINLCCSTT